MKRLRARPVFWAFVCAGLVLLWQAATVHFNYRGDWSALFYTGAYVRLPAVVEAERPFRIAHDPGYDGQFYHLIAHDPFLRGDVAQYVDNPRLRWRRILVPAAAWIISLGNDDYIDSNYALVLLACVFLGALWLGRYCLQVGLRASGGTCFALVPSVIASVDRATVDVALAALCAGFAVEQGWRLWLVLALAPLARETGVVLPLAYGVRAAIRKDRQAALFGASTLIPCALWFGYVALRTAPDRTVFAGLVPLRGLVERTLHPQLGTAGMTSWVRTAAAFDYVGVLGMWVAVGLALSLLVRRLIGRVELAAMLFTGIFVMFVAQPQVWEGAYSFGRTMSPVLLFLAMIGAATGRPAWFVPLALVLPRFLFQLSPQWRGILQGVKQALLHGAK